MNHPYIKGISCILMCLFLFTNIKAQDDCVPIPGEVIIRGGEITLNYGSTTNAVNSRRASNIILGEPAVGQSNDTKNTTEFGFYSQFLLPPQAPVVTPSQGEWLDRIQIQWDINPLGGASTGGFNLYRDGIFLDYVGPKIRSYNDFNVIAGRPYTYSVTGLNDFGEGSLGKGLGFIVPNGVVTGQIETPNGNPVVNATVSLDPMQGFSTMYGAQDGGGALFDPLKPFFPSGSSDWTISFWVKTLSATANKGILDFGANIAFKALESTGPNGVFFSTASGDLTATFAEANRSDWHHITVTHKGNNHNTRMFLDGVLVMEKNLPVSFTPCDLNIGDRVIGGGGWEGSLDELRIYHRALDEVEVGEAMKSTASSDTPDLAYYWKMDEELGAKCFDNINRHIIYLCGSQFNVDRPNVSTAAKTNEDGYYRIEGVSYGTGTTFLATPTKKFYSKRALQFNSEQEDVVLLPPFPIASKSTLELWFNGSTNPNQQTILARKFGSNELKISLLPNGNNLDLEIGTNGSNNIMINDIGLGYKHLALTMDNGNVSVFINGILTATGTLDVTDLTSSTQPWYLGASENGTSDFFNGYIDEIALYDTLLNAIQISEHYTSARSITEAHLNVYFPLDEGSGNIVYNVGALQLDPATLGGAEWSIIAPLQQATPHEFTPRTRQVTLNPSVTSVDQVDFVDRSTIPVSGYVRFKDTDCFQPKVEILVNGESFIPKIFTDEEGKFVIDFDPGTTAILRPKYEEHTFSPAFWEVTNVTNPIAGILFNNTVSRKVTGQVAGGDCRQSIIKDPGLPTGTVCTVKLRTADGCFEQLQTINNVDTGLDEGDYEFLSLPPFENLIVSIIEHSDPSVKNYFQALGGSTVDLKVKDTIVDFIYHSEPKIEIVSGLESYSPNCDVIVMAQFDLETIGIKLKEEYLDGNSCYIDSANFRIINELGGEIKDTTSSNGILNYKFKVGAPNPSAPHTKSLQIVATTLDGNDTEFTTSAIITGVRAKQNSFTSTLPETPFIVLRDPPGDGSYATIEAGETFCRSLKKNAADSKGFGVQVVTDFNPDWEFPGFFGAPTVEFESTIGPELTAVLSTHITKESTTEYCLTTKEKFSTSENDLVTGPHGGDLFVGGALNVEFGFVDVIRFDTTLCEGVDSLAINFGARDFATTFIYTEYYIRNTILYQLEELKNTVTNPADTLLFYRSINNWNKILSDNAKLKKNAKPIKNISVAAGTVYEFSETIDTTVVNSIDTSFNDKEDLSQINEFYLNGAGGGISLITEFEQVSGMGVGNTTSNEITTSYVITDDDELDAFSIDVAHDPVYKTPVFNIKAGQSSCPWEPGTAKREGVYLESVDGPFRTDVPADQPAVFKFLMHNTSATNETWTYAFTAGPESNPHSAKIYCNGAPMNQIQWYAIPWGTTIPVTVTLERGPVEYDYNDLEIVLYSACEDQRANDLGILPDTAVNLYSAVYISANFIRPCSEVKINVPEQDWVVFPDPLTAGNDDIRRITVSGYDTTATDFQLIRLQYRRTNGDGAWVNILPQAGTSFEAYNGNWSGFDDLPVPKPPKLQPIFTQFFWNTEGLADGDYEIRAVTICTGDAANRPGASETIRGRIDREPPKLLGVPQPSDGVYHVGDEVSFTFNQDINCNKLIQADIFNANNVGLYDATTNDLIDCEISCSGNKIILVPNFDNKFFENRILRAELRNIEDLTGNKNIYQEWEFYVDRNELAWLSDSIEVVKFVDETKTFSAKIHNRGGYPVPFVIDSIPNWLHVFPDRGTLVANEIEEIFFTIKNDMDLGEAMKDIVLITQTGLNPFFMGGTEPLHIKARNLCRPETWVLNPSGFNISDYDFSMNFIVQLNIEGTLSVDENDLVGAYVDGQLRGIAKIKYQPSINKYLAFLTVYSDVSNGEIIKFQIWDASDCKLYAYALETFNFLSDDIRGTVSNCIILHTNTTLLRKIFLNSGWNWISMNLNMVPNTVNNALSTLSSPQGASIKSQTQVSQYSNTASSWIGNLATVSPDQMYQYNSQVKDSVSIIGNYIDPAANPIPLITGWNWIGYVPTQSLKVDDALASIEATTGDVIKGQLHFAQYLAGTGWIGNLESMNAPNGYLLKVGSTSNNNWLVYPDPLQLKGDDDAQERKPVVPASHGLTTLQSTPPAKMPFSHWKVDPSQYEYSMNVIAIVSENGQSSNILQDGDEVAALVNGQVRGSAKAHYVEALSAYMIFMTIYSNKADEQLKLKYYDASENTEYDLVEKFNFKINHIQGMVDAPQPLHKVGTSSVIPVGMETAVEMYPNPFTGALQIHCTMINPQDIQMTIKDVYGKIVDKQPIRLRQGAQSIEWRPVSHLPGGTYFVTLEMESDTYTEKVIYIR